MDLMEGVATTRLYDDFYSCMRKNGFSEEITKTLLLRTNKYQNEYHFRKVAPLYYKKGTSTSVYEKNIIWSWLGYLLGRDSEECYPVSQAYVYTMAGEEGFESNVSFCQDIEDNDELWVEIRKRFDLLNSKQEEADKDESAIDEKNNEALDKVLKEMEEACIEVGQQDFWSQFVSILDREQIIANDPEIEEFWSFMAFRYFIYWCESWAQIEEKSGTSIVGYIINAERMQTFEGSQYPKKVGIFPQVWYVNDMNMSLVPKNFGIYAHIAHDCIANQILVKDWESGIKAHLFNKAYFKKVVKALQNRMQMYNEKLFGSMLTIN